MARISLTDYQLATTVEVGIKGLWTADINCVLELDEYGFVVAKYLLQQNKTGDEVLTELVGGIGSEALEQVIATELDHQIRTCPILKDRINDFKRAMLFARAEAAAEIKWQERVGK